MDIQYWKKYEDIEYIPNSKIYFEIELNDSPYIFKQKSLIDINKNYYNIHYRIPAKECIKKSMELSENLPALFRLGLMLNICNILVLEADKYRLGCCRNELAICPRSC